MARVGRWSAGVLVFLAMSGMAAPSSAHRSPSREAVSDRAITIPTLTHGQMSVIAANLPAILALADGQTPTDPTLRRLQGFIALQRFACFRGLVPGSVSDEASPFNECAHAYLAATRALLLHLAAMPGDRAAVQALVARIERDMLVRGTALTLCRYSDEPFDTAAIIAPHWADVPRHPPTSGTLAGALGLLCASGWLLSRRRAPASDGVPRPQK